MPHVHDRALDGIVSADNAGARERLIIAQHHPDHLRRPAPRPGAVAQDRFRHALLWNVFRTLELLPPPFWLRRLQARLRLEWFPSAPEMARISLWHALTLPPAHHRDGAQPDVVVDVMIETEHAVWTLITADEMDAGATAVTDRAALIIDATSWYAGTRGCSIGVLSRPSAPQDPGVALVERYFRSKDSLRLRSSWLGDSLSNVRGIGSLGWADLADILRDGQHAEVLSDIERVLARHALAWLDRAGIS